MGKTKKLTSQDDVNEPKRQKRIYEHPIDSDMPLYTIAILPQENDKEWYDFE